VRRERLPKTAQLEPHREELLRLRRDGDSVEVLATALRGFGVEISCEALRLWLNRQLPRRNARRSKKARVPARHELAPVTPPVQGGPIAANLATTLLALATPVAVEPVSPASAGGFTTAPKTPAPASPIPPCPPWKSNFTPLVVGSPRRNPRIARDDL
jgi:hypothetical protein